jgi:hypothetical protein
MDIHHFEDTVSTEDTVEIEGLVDTKNMGNAH